MKIKSFLLFFLILFLTNFLQCQSPDGSKKAKLIEKGEYIIGDIYKLKFFEKQDSEKHPFKERFFRVFNLSYDFLIDRATYDAKFVLPLVNDEKYKKISENFSKSVDPYKYHKLKEGYYEAYMSFKDAENFCKQRGGRVPKDYEIEIALKYYYLYGGPEYGEYKDGNGDFNVYYEFAFDKDENPIIIKYFKGRIKNIKNNFIFIDDRIKIKKDQYISASIN